MSKSKAPTGLKLTRNGNKFTAKWKIAAKDYADGQGFRWRTHWKKTENGKTATGASSWHTESIKKKATKHSFKVDFDNDFYDNMNKKLTSVEFQVRGNEGKYKKKDKKTKKEVTVNNSMSDWSSEEFKCSAPPKPTLTFTTGTWPAATCKLKCDVKNTGAHPYEGMEYQSVLLKNSNVTDGASVNWDSTLTPVYDSTTNQKEYTLSITEDSGRLADGASYTRWVRARAWGASGNSSWAYAKHVYAVPNAPKITEYDAKKEGSNYNCTVKFDVPKSTARPISTVRVEWLIDTPVMKQPSQNYSSMDTDPPAGATWNEGITVKPADKTSGAVFIISSQCGIDECLWLRAVAVYSDYENPGNAVTAAHGVLDTPTGLSVSEGADFKFTVSATNNCSIKTSNNLDASVLAVKYYDSKHPNGVNVGVTSASPTTIQCPARATGETCRIGVFAIVGTYYQKTGSDSVKNYRWIYETAGFKSAVLDDGGSIPLPPANVSVNAAETPGTVTVSWDWTWDQATGAELSWADHDDAWISTDEPSTYIVNRNMASSWNISGLETGKVWYVRVRLFKTTDGEDTFGGYSNILSINLAEAPLIPVLDLSDPIITVDGEVTASWGYSTMDGTMQAGAVIAEKNGGTYTKLGEVQTQQTYTISAKEQGWTVGTTHLICVKVTSASGLECDDWSVPVAVTVADPVTCSITSTNLVDSYDYAFTDNAIGSSITSYDIDWATMRSEVGVDANNQITVTVTSATDGEADGVSITGASTYTPSVSDWDDYGLNHIYIGTFDPADADIVEDVTATAVKLLQALPLTATVTGAGDTGTTTLIIERAETYIIDQPDETEFNVYKGETIAMLDGNGSFSVGLNDLIGSLDDGADYNLIATVQDGLGQSASETILFTAAWSHQAEPPKATVEIDGEKLAALITPIAPDNYVSGDTCDIYRLSVDRPQLIRKGATFGEKYVDPYPAIGYNGGYRFVTITKDGDYITPDNHLAWLDVYESIDVRFNIIDFEEGQARLTYNCDISNEWSKDFEQTAYLGGSVVGDWNKAIRRSSTVTGTAVEAVDGDTVEIMRRLADYPGICHVRTKDGSSYAADVQVGDKYNYASGVKYTDYSLKISRVETEGYDCITYAEWLELQNEESE